MVLCRFYTRFLAKQIFRRNFTTKSKEKVQIKRLSETYSPVKLAYAMYGVSMDDEYFLEKSMFCPPLVVVHGLFGHKANWHSISRAINRKLECEVVTVDMRNHGTSPQTSSMNYLEMAADLELLIESEILDSDFYTGFSKVALLGHSMGGKAATVLALSRPDLIDTLIIEDITPKNYEEGGATHYLPKYVAAMLELEGDFSDFSSVPAARKFADEKLSLSVEDESTRQFLLTNLVEKNGVVQWKMNLHTIRNHSRITNLQSSTDRNGLSFVQVRPVASPIGDNMENIIGFPELPPDAKFHGPTLVVDGELSQYIKESDKAIFREYFSNVEFASIEGAGHWVHYEKPYDFIDVVQDKLLIA